MKLHKALLTGAMAQHPCFLILLMLASLCNAEPKPRPRAKAKAQGLEYYGEYDEGDYSYYGSGKFMMVKLLKFSLVCRYAKQYHTLATCGMLITTNTCVSFLEMLS